MRHKTLNTRHTTSDQRLTLKSSRILFLSLVFSLWSFAAFAANYDIKEMTPEVREALAGRQQRYSELQAAKHSGAVSENGQGLVSGNSELVNAENHDRMVIYRAIADQNGIGLGQVQQAFAETIRERGQ